MTREDPDGAERLIQCLFLLPVIISLQCNPLVAFFIYNEDIEVYNHLLVFMYRLGTGDPGWRDFCHYQIIIFNHFTGYHPWNPRQFTYYFLSFGTHMSLRVHCEPV